MSGEETVLVRVQGDVAHVTLNRPEEMNAITVELGRSLHAALASASESAGAIVVEGAGDHFSVGGDYKELQRLRADGEDAVAEIFTAFGAACDSIAALPVPVVAAVHGYAMAGGFELMQSCDIAIVAETAVLADNHLNFAMVPGGGGSQRLPRLLGRQRALAHILDGERLSGIEAAGLGLALRAVPPEELRADAAELAGRLATKDSRALAEAKRLVYVGLELPLAEGLALEREAVVRHLAAEGSMAPFQSRPRRDQR